MSPGYFGGGGGVTAHNQLTGLTSDDHAQYASHKLQRSYGYVMGGDTIGGGVPTAMASRYDDVADLWTNKDGMNNVIYGNSGFHLNGYGYSLAGNTGAVTNKVDKYDDVADLWTAKTVVNTSREASTGFSLAGFGYCTGGNPGSLTTHEKYDDVANTWTAKTGMITGRYNASSFHLAGYGYVAGGSGPASANERYDDIVDAWITKQRTILATEGGPCGFSINGYGYEGSGYSGVVYTAHMERYDSISNTWLDRQDLGLNAANIAFTSLNGYGYRVGGIITGGSVTGRTEKYDDVANTWTAKTALGTARRGMPGFSQGQLTEQKYLSPEIVNILRSVSYRAVICGSFNTSATSSGYCNIAHGLGTAPTAAWAIPIRTAANVGAISLDLKGLGGTNLTFVVSSCPVTTFSPTTSSISVNFVWGAKP